MFTGIVTDVGEVVSAEQRGDLRLQIRTGYDRQRSITFVHLVYIYNSGPPGLIAGRRPQCRYSTCRCPTTRINDAPPRGS